MSSTNATTSPRKFVDPRAEAALAWWRRLAEQDTASAGPNLRGDRADLRRARSPGDAYAIPSFHALLRAIGGSEATEDHTARSVAVLAALLAHVKDHEDGGYDGFAGQCAAGQDGPTVSELRFRRLLQKDSSEDLQADLLRTLHLLGGRADVRDLATSVLHWNDRTRRRWAFTYYQRANLNK